MLLAIIWRLYFAANIHFCTTYISSHLIAFGGKKIPGECCKSVQNRPRQAAIIADKKRELNRKYTSICGRIQIYIQYLYLFYTEMYLYFLYIGMYLEYINVFILFV